MYKSSFLFIIYISSLSFNAFGYIYNDVFLSISYLLYFILLISSVKYISIRNININFLILSLFIIFCFISNMYKNGLYTYLTSVLMLIFFSSHFLIGIHKRYNIDVLIISLKFSYLFLIFSVLIDFISFLIFGINPSVLSNLGLHGSSISYYGFPRLRGFQLEPSILAYVSLFFLLMFNKINYYKDINILYRFTPLLVIFSTMSPISIIFLFYIMISMIFTGNFLKYIKKNTFSLLTIFPLLLYLIFTNFSAQVFKVFEKLSSIVTVIETVNLNGSVGYRVFSLLEPFYFIRDSNFLYVFTGTGFSNYSEYILKKYKYLDFSGFASGDLNSLFSAVLISTGLIGFSIFFYFIYRSCRDNNLSIFVDYNFLLIIFVLINYGNLNNPFLWIFIIFTYSLNKQVDNVSFINSNN